MFFFCLSGRNKEATVLTGGRKAGFQSVVSTISRKQKRKKKSLTDIDTIY